MRRVRSYYVDPQPDENFPGSQDFPPPPFPAIRVATTGFTVTATPVPWAEYDGVAVAMTARAPRQPRRRASRGRRARSPDRQADDGPEPPPALAGKRYALTCEACEEPFVSTRPHTRTCSPRCRKRLERMAAGTDADLLRLGDLARGLVSTGQLEPVAALSLVIWPTDRVRQALRVTA